MKNLLQYIKEALIKKTSKIVMPMSKKEIINYVCIMWGFVPDQMENDEGLNLCMEIIDKWIEEYHINNVSKGYFYGETATQNYFDILYEQVEKLLGKEKAKEFNYIENKSIKDIESYKSGTKIKLKGYSSIWISYNENEIAIISDAGSIQEGRIVRV